MAKYSYPGIASLFIPRAAKTAADPALTRDNPDYWVPPSERTTKYKAVDSTPPSTILPSLTEQRVLDQARATQAGTTLDQIRALDMKKPYPFDYASLSAEPSVGASSSVVVAKPVAGSGSKNLPGLGMPEEWAKGKTQYTKRPAVTDNLLAVTKVKPLSDELAASVASVAGSPNPKVMDLVGKLSDWLISHPKELGYGAAGAAGLGLGAYGLHKLLSRDDEHSDKHKKTAMQKTTYKCASLSSAVSSAVLGVPEVQLQDFRANPLLGLKPNDVTRTKYNMGDISRIRLAGGLRPPEGTHPMAELYKETDPEKFVAKGNAIYNKFHGKGGTTDVAVNPIGGNSRRLGNEVTSAAGSLWDTIKNKYTNDIAPWFKDPANIEKLKTWGIPIATGLGAMGLYSLLSPKQNNEGTLGRLARMGLVGAGGAGLGYAALKYGPNLYQQGKTLLSKQSSAPVVWSNLDEPSKRYLTGFVKACRAERIDPTGFVPVSLVKAAEGVMGRPLYIDLLTREERMDALKLGLKLARLQLGVKQADAGVLDTAASAVEKAILGVAVLTGVPLGIAGHMLSRAAKSDELAQRERRAKIRYYRDITSELEQGLAGSNPVPARV